MSSTDLLLAATKVLDSGQRASMVLEGRRLLARERVYACTRCRLSSMAQVTAPVPWDGGPSSVLMLGEAPGREEDVAGRPFVGRAGRLLWETLDTLGVQREQVASGNVVSCRPPSNDFNMAVAESAPALCAPHFEAMVEFTRPILMVCLGARSLAHVTGGVRTKVGATRGRVWWSKRHYLWVTSTWHPAYVLRNGGAMGEFTDDLRVVPKVLSGVADLPRPEFTTNFAGAFARTDDSYARKIRRHWGKHGWVPVSSSRLGRTVILERERGASGDRGAAFPGAFTLTFDELARVHREPPAMLAGLVALRDNGIEFEVVA